MVALVVAPFELAGHLKESVLRRSRSEPTAHTGLASMSLTSPLSLLCLSLTLCILSLLSHGNERMRSQAGSYGADLYPQIRQKSDVRCRGAD